MIWKETKLTPIEYLIETRIEKSKQLLRRKKISITEIAARSPLHNIGGCLNIYENIDVEIIKKSINYLIKNNDGLRLRINESRDEPSQYLADFLE